MLISAYKIQGQTKRDLIIAFFKESGKMRYFRRKLKENRTSLYEKLMDMHGNLAQVALFQINLFDHILTMEVFS